MKIFEVSKARLNVVGIMSGTSFDGVDYILTAASKDKIAYKDMASVAYPPKLKKKLMALAEGNLSFRVSQELSFELGKFYAQNLEKIKKTKKWKFDLIGLHGQTVYHRPPKATTQIGEQSFLKLFNVPVVSDFRSKILSVGGEGAPLAPLFHLKLMSNQKKWAFLNLGGMSNVTKKIGKDFSASDLGPANVFLDAAAKKMFNKNFDKGGVEALKGIPDLAFVKNYCMNNAFIKKKAPKSCGREDFSELEFEKIYKELNKKISKTFNKNDLIATLAEISLFPILKDLKSAKIETLVVSGGGAYNMYFMKRLEKEFLDVDVMTSEEMDWPIQAVEGAAFAMLAFNKIKNIKSDLSYMGLKKQLSPLGRVD